MNGAFYVAEFNQIRRLNPSGTDVLRKTAFRAHWRCAHRSEYRPSEEVPSTSFIDIVARQMACTPF